VVCIHHSCFIPEGVVVVCQIFLRNTHVLPKLVGYEDVTGGKPIAVFLQSISGVSAINTLVFYDSHGGKEGKEIIQIIYLLIS
jgi:hypothetical protein